MDSINRPEICVSWYLTSWHLVASHLTLKVFYSCLCYFSKALWCSRQLRWDVITWSFIYMGPYHKPFRNLSRLLSDSFFFFCTCWKLPYQPKIGLSLPLLESFWIRTSLLSTACSAVFTVWTLLLKTSTISWCKLVNFFN